MVGVATTAIIMRTLVCAVTIGVLVMCAVRGMDCGCVTAAALPVVSRYDMLDDGVRFATIIGTTLMHA